MIFHRWFLKGRLRKALDLLNCGMYPEAAAELRGVLASFSDRQRRDHQGRALVFYLAECYMSMGDQKLEAGDLSGARKDFEAAAALEVDFADLYFRIGKVSLGLQDLDGAAAALEQAVTRNPHYVQARLLRAELFARREDWQAAVEEYRHLGQRGVLRDEERYARGLREAGQGNAERAAKILQESFRLRPEPVQALFAKGMRCYREGDYAGAVRELKEAAALHPEYPDIHNALGVACCGTGAYAEAEEAFGRAMEQNAAYAEPRLNLGFLHARRGRPDRAKALFEQVLEMEPENVIAREGLENLLSGEESPA